MAELLADTNSHDAAFNRYVVPEIEVLYRVARSITRNPTDAEDLVQDTMLRAYRAVDRFDGRHPTSLVAHHHAQRSDQPGATQAT